MLIEEVAQIDICATDMVGRFMVRDVVTPEFLHFLEDGQKKGEQNKEIRSLERDKLIRR